MALSLMLRNSTKLRGLSVLPRSNLQQLQKTQNYTQFLNKNHTKTVSFASKCKMQFINVAQQTKRNMSGDHSKMWTVEKLVSLTLLGVVPATFICPNNILDNIFAVAVVIHFHWGLEACIIDYVRPIVVGPILPKIAIALLYLISATTLAALLYYNHHDIGIGETVRRFWSISGCLGEDERKALEEAQGQ